MGPSVVEMQRKLKANPPRKELPGVWTDGVPSILQEVSPIPELRNALEFGDAATMARVGALVAQGSEKHDGSSDRSSRRQEKVHRSHTAGWELSVRNSRFGLGEASHSGTQGLCTRADEVLDNLEHVLRLIESDGESLVRPTVGRNVFPRIN